MKSAVDASETAGDERRMGDRGRRKGWGGGRGEDGVTKERM